MDEFNNGKLSVNVYPFQGVALFNQDLESYYKNNMALLDQNVRNSLFRGELPIYTRCATRCPPTTAPREIADCVVADGCRLFGKMENSVVFGEVMVRRAPRCATAS